MAEHRDHCAPIDPCRPAGGCGHQHPCPTADAPDRDAARIVAEHHDQGWVLLCNGVVLFEDTGELLPDGRVFGRRTGLATTAA